jgi:hypothetical protein
VPACVPLQKQRLVSVWLFSYGKPYHNVWLYVKPYNGQEFPEFCAKDLCNVLDLQ